MIGSSQKKRGTPSLDNDEQKYRRMFDNAVLGLFSADQQGRFIEVNRAFSNILGYESPEEVLKSGVYGNDILVNAEDAGIYSDLIERYGFIINFETQVYRKDKTRIWVSISTKSDTGTDNGQSARYGIIEDITQRKIVEEELAQKAADLARSNADLEQFAHIASHDLQEPLRMVASFTELLARKYKGRLDKDADEFISIAVDGANRMKQLINDLLVFSRVGSKAKPFEPTDFNEVLNHSMGNLAMIIKEHSANVEADQLPVLMADKNQMIQLFQNLMSNAIKFHSLVQPRIKISASLKESLWTFSINDNGIGIDPQHFERIFGVFQRVHGKRDYPGTGIGLAICKKIVERHGGRIWVESEQGKGSTFFFTIAG
jgi:PAS domain S-box-containing protein